MMQRAKAERQAEVDKQRRETGVEPEPFEPAYDMDHASKEPRVVEIDDNNCPELEHVNKFLSDEQREKNASEYDRKLKANVNAPRTKKIEATKIQEVKEEEEPRVVEINDDDEDEESEEAGEQQENNQQTNFTSTNFEELD